MKYYFNKIISENFDSAVEKISNLLKEEGFGILTEIDIKDTLKKKIGADFRKYKILGACNPNFAYQALQIEDKIGLMMPCNIIVEENREGKTEVSAINPMITMKFVDNPALEKFAQEVSNRLKLAIERL